MIKKKDCSHAIKLYWGEGDRKFHFEVDMSINHSYEQHFGKNMLLNYNAVECA